MKGEFLPQRTCVCCRTKTDKSALIRFIDDNGAIIIDNAKSKPARGVYVCRNCAEAKGKQLFKSLSRAFRRQITESDFPSQV